MIEFFNLEIDKNLLIGSFLTFIVSIIIFIKLIPTYCTSFFGECVANHKSSKHHSPMIRGLGIVFPAILILSAVFWESVFSNFEIFIITISTIVGFWDDRFDLSQKRKLFIFLLIGFLWSLSKVNYFIDDLEILLKFIIYIFIFVFLILFFNQIDGINGLASITFLISLIFIHMNLLNLFFILPLFLCVGSYFFINLKGKIGIQGDAGSFFMGSFIAILFSKSIALEKFGVIFLILGPVVFDVCATTLVRIYYKIDLTKGHRNNLYQKVVAKYQNHILATLLIGSSQLLFYYLLLFFLETESIYNLYILLISFYSFLIILFYIISYLIHNEKILR